MVRSFLPDRIALNCIGTCAEAAGTPFRSIRVVAAPVPFKREAFRAGPAGEERDDPGESEEVVRTAVVFL